MGLHFVHPRLNPSTPPAFSFSPPEPRPHVRLHHFPFPPSFGSRASWKEEETQRSRRPRKRHPPAHAPFTFLISTIPSPRLAWCKSSSLPPPHSPSHVPPSLRERALPSTRTSLPPAPRHRVTESPPLAHADAAHDIVKFARVVVRHLLPPPPETELEPESEPEKSPGMDFVFPGARAMAAETSGVGTMRRMLGTLAAFVIEAVVVVVVVVVV
ncbi:hypothetical protein B0H14DRAFT_3468478 [Mycena olivaceomarginata]|nr:hypothetical protein B0H14DRAFT_3468478 [Mycena olivaceomarginata]